MSISPRRLFALLVALILAGCSSAPATAPAPSSPAPPPPPPTWQGTLSLWLPAPPATAGGREALDRRLAAYNSAHPTVQVQVEIKDEVNAALAGATDRPDLALAAFDPHLWPRGCPPPGGSGAPSADWLPGVAAALAPSGTLCGVPLYVQGQVLALNLAAWQAAGVEPPAGGQWTLDQFAATLQALKAGQVSPLSFFTLPGYDAWWPLLLADGGRLLDAAGRELALSESALARLAAWEQAGLIDPDAGKLPPEAVYAAFAASPPRLAMLPVPAHLLPSFRLPPYQVDQLGVAAFPDGANLGKLYGYLFTGNGDGERRAAALDLALTLTDAEAQLAWARAAGGFPAARSAGNPYPGDVPLTAAQAALAGLQPLPGGPWWQQAQTPLGRHLQLAVIGGETPAAALAAARQAMAPSFR